MNRKLCIRHTTGKTEPAKIQADRAGDLEKWKEICLNVDYRQTGVAGVDSWGYLPPEQYRVNYDSYRYRYVIQPVDGKSVDDTLSFPALFVCACLFI